MIRRPPRSTLSPYTTHFRPVVAQPQQPPEQPVGVAGPANQGVVVGQPEAAGQKGAFPAGEPVHRLPGRPGRVTSVDANAPADRKSTRLNSSHANISYAVFCL